MNPMAIEIPLRLRGLPRYGGYPVPVMVALDQNGKPDFRVTEVGKWTWVVKNKLCSLCGQPLKKTMYFIGGELSTNNGVYYDPPTHRECGEYALKVCPYLATPRERREAEPKMEGVTVVTHSFAAAERPERFGFVACRGFRVLQLRGEYLLQIQEPVGLTWWKDGNPNHET